VRYSTRRVWVTVASSDERAVVARLASEAYRDLPDADGREPVAVRVITRRSLRSEAERRRSRAPTPSPGIREAT
jgi:hypothetical protein